LLKLKIKTRAGASQGGKRVTAAMATTKACDMEALRGNGTATRFASKISPAQKARLRAFRV